MQKIYCSKCGNPNLYTQAKPKFCSACGTPFYGVIVEKPQDKKLRENKVRVQEEMVAFKGLVLGFIRHFIFALVYRLLV